MQKMLEIYLDNMKFAIGNVVITNGVDNLIQENDEFRKFVSKSFCRHCNGDWGDMCDEDKAMNESALANGDDRLFSKYDFDNHVSIYIITEWDRSVTTVLFPEEY